MALFSCRSMRVKAKFETSFETATEQIACRKASKEAAARVLGSRRFSHPLNTFSRSVTFGALHAALDPVECFYARRRIDAFGGKVLDVDQIDALGIGIIFGAAEGDRLDRLMAVSKLHLNQAAGRLPFEPRHGLNQFIGRRLLAAILGHGFKPSTDELVEAMTGLEWQSPGGLIDAVG